MSSDNTSPICPICTIKLSCGHIGCTVPCGHIFHIKCFEEWRVHCSNKLIQQSDSVPDRTSCPICNEEIKDFIRLYSGLYDSSDSDDDTIDLTKTNENTEELERKVKELKKELSWVRKEACEIMYLNRETSIALRNANTLQDSQSELCLQSSV